MKKKFSLLQYSTAAVALLGATAASSQVVYTDIDPDVVLDEPDEMFGIDLDGDGLNDFNFFNESYSATVFYMDFGNVNAIFAGVFDTMQNGIMAQTVYLSGAGGYTYVLPTAIESGIVINDSNIFFNDNYQTLVKTVRETGYFPSTFNWGYWNSYFWGEQIEKFLGFRFADEENIRRYGWIRCSVIDSGRTLIIHDYAYELQAEYPIVAGDTISYVNVSEQNFLNASVYSFGDKVFINLNSNSSVNLRIVDATGSMIMEKTLDNHSEIIDMAKYPSAIYIINLTQDDKHLTKKIIIN